MPLSITLTLYKTSKHVHMDVRYEKMPMSNFGYFLLELISGQPKTTHGVDPPLVLFLESIVHVFFTQLIVQLLAI